MSIRIYGPIGHWGITAAEIVDQIDDGADELTLYINSPGGDAFEALTVMNALRASPATVTAVVEGVAASAASIIAVGGADRLIMRPGSELMIHDAWADCAGDAATLVEVSEQLARTSDSLAKIYADKAGGDVATWREAMRRESWYSAEEAVEAGLADAVEDGRVSPPAPKNMALLSRYAYAGRKAAPPPPPETMHKEAADMIDVKNEGELITLLKQLLVKLVDGDNARHSDETPEGDNTPEDTPDEAPEETPEESADEAAELLTIEVDRDAFAELQKLAEYGREAKTRDEARAREAAVDDAIRLNKIAHSARARWLKAMTVDEPGTRATLAKIEPNTIPRAEIGHALDPDPEAAPVRHKPFKFSAVNV